MERSSIKLLLLLALFMVASLLPLTLMAQITGRLCKSHDDCKPNSVYSNNFCNKISGSEIGRCVGFDSTLEMVMAKEGDDAKAAAPYEGCGVCETDADCWNCPAGASCETYLTNGTCS